MEKYFSRLLDYLLNVLLSTYNQLFILFGPLLVLVVLLNLSAIFTARLSVRFWGRNLFLYGFAWLGCSVHELSHAFFALIFGHKISEVELFKPNSNGESLGHVSHSYNKKSIYQKIGNFFIGISPLLFGGVVLFLITLLLFGFNIVSLSSFRITSHDFTNLLLLKQLATSIWHSLLSYFTIVFTGSGAVWWKSALLIYVLYSTGSSMTLSKSDVGSAFSGFLWLIIIFLVFNLITLWYGNFASVFLNRIVGYISGFYFLMILSLMANLLFIMILFVLNLIKSLFVRR
ncbi:MAG: hypothetical protein NTY07_19820 [Bacteroidia bacterium]|nr:hypothetical protein [Bacteroidia bacterium]